MSRKDKKIARLKKDFNFYKYSFNRAIVEINEIKRDNPFCSVCKEKDCLVSMDETCEMVRKYLKAVKNEKD